MVAVRIVIIMILVVATFAVPCLFTFNKSEPTISTISFSFLKLHRGIALPK